MQPTKRSSLPRFDFNLSWPVYFLLGIALLELVLYRFLANVEMYAGVGAEGFLALLANIGSFSMVATGVLSLFLLLAMLPKLINNPLIDGLWWRGVLILISPIYLLIIMWAIWTRLSDWLLIAGVFGAMATICIVVIFNMQRPIPHRFKRIWMGLGLMLMLATFAWTILDFLEIDRLNRLGNFSLKAFLVAEGIMIGLPIFAYFVFCFDSKKHFQLMVLKPHIPAIGITIIITIAGALAVGYAQKQGSLDGSISFIETTQYFIRVAYRTGGITLAIPGGPLLCVVSLFFISLTTTTLLIPYGDWQTNKAKQTLGTGFAMIYIAGLQPFSVYQYSLSLLGFILMAMGFGELYPTVAVHSKQDTINELLLEMDGNHTHGEKSNGESE